MQESYLFTIKRAYIENYRNYLLDRECSVATIEKYIRDIEKFYTFLDGQTQVSKQIIILYKEYLLRNYAASSVNSMLVPLNQFWDFLEAGKLKIRLVKIQKQMFSNASKTMTKMDYQKLLNTAIQEGKGQLAMIIETIATTGIRISELKYFTVEQVKKGRITVQNKGKQRIVLLPKQLKQKSLYYAKKNGINTGIIFCTKNGKEKDRSNIWREMKRLSKRAGVGEEKIFPHNLRHLFAREFYNLTHNLINLADILGHSSLEVTRIYTKDMLEKCQLNINKLYCKFNI